MLYYVRNVVAHGDAREGKWKGNWQMECVASTLTRPRNVVYPALLTLMRTPRLPAVDWTDYPADLNGLVRLGGIRNVVSARVPSCSARALLTDNLRAAIGAAILTEQCIYTCRPLNISRFVAEYHCHTSYLSVTIRNALHSYLGTD